MRKPHVALHQSHLWTVLEEVPEPMCTVPKTLRLERIARRYEALKRPSCGDSS